MRIGLPILLIIALSVSVGLYSVANSSSFPGFGNGIDCANCHNEPATAYNQTYESTAITVDGNGNEAFWEETFGRAMRIPVGTLGGFPRDLLFVELIFAQNETHLFVYANWEDPSINGTDTPMYAPADAFAICWNINAKEFTAAYFGGMRTPKVGEKVDTWQWKPAASETGTQVDPATGTTKGVIGIIQDYSYDDRGWATDTKQDVLAGATHGNQSEHSEENYALEMVRPLVTEDPDDVQFNKSGLYQFAISIQLNGSAADHWVSFEHEVWIRAQGDNGHANDNDENTAAGFGVLTISLGFMFLAFVVVFRRSGSRQNAGRHRK